MKVGEGAYFLKMHCNAYLLALQMHNFRRFQLLADTNNLLIVAEAEGLHRDSASLLILVGVEPTSGKW